jgi:type II secretory pathway predicted ATPase ExeA
VGEDREGGEELSGKIFGVMRYFNTSGPCNPAQHYTVLRQALVAEGMEKVRPGRYLTIFAPRQSGKTTFFRLLAGEMFKNGQFTPIQISFENLKTLARDRFYEELDHVLNRELTKHGIKPPRSIKDQVDLERFFEELRHQRQGWVLIVDEFEGIPQSVLGEVMHTFRRIYHERENYALHSLILVGVSTIAELIVSSTTSPFNIIDENKIPYFSLNEVRELIGQYAAENGQKFDKDVIKAIYENSAGQPGLVCALCAHLVEKVATNRTNPVAMEDFYKTLTHFLTERFDKNIINIVQKAREKQAFMLRLLFGEEPIPYDTPS